MQSSMKKKKKNEGKNWKENGEKRVRNIDGEQLESISNNVTPVIARALEKVVYHTYVRKPVEEYLTPTQFDYRQGGNCANAVICIQHHVYTEYLDNQDSKAVRIFTMDFSKAFDSVNHSLLSAKLKQLPLNPNIVNLYHSFLHERQQRVSSGNHVCTWQAVNKGNDSGNC